MITATGIITFILILLWFLLWTWYRSQRYMKKIIHQEQWKVLGITGLIVLIIIITLWVITIMIS